MYVYIYTYTHTRARTHTHTHTYTHTHTLAIYISMNNNNNNLYVYIDKHYAGFGKSKSAATFVLSRARYLRDISRDSPRSRPCKPYE